MSFNSPGVAKLNTSNLPRHVAIIMDGNGRWAQKRLLNRVKGHEKGAETVREVARACREFGIQFLTLYAFSTENWQRPKTEVSALMQLLKNFLGKEAPELNANDIRLGVIGQPQRLPEDVRNVLERTIATTAQNKGLLLNLALSYGGRAELTEMARTLASKAVSGELSPEAIDESVVTEHLYTRDLPDPDILIRTGGEMRISNFMLWQLAYAEFFITSTLWPDFNRNEFIGIIREYQRRDRRFGRVPDA